MCQHILTSRSCTCSERKHGPLLNRKHILCIHLIIVSTLVATQLVAFELHSTYPTGLLETVFVTALHSPLCTGAFLERSASVVGLLQERACPSMSLHHQPKQCIMWAVDRLDLFCNAPWSPNVMCIGIYHILNLGNVPWLL